MQPAEGQDMVLLGPPMHSILALRVAPNVAAFYQSHLPGRDPAGRPYWEPYMRPLFMAMAIAVAWWQFGRFRCG